MVREVETCRGERGEMEMHAHEALGLQIEDEKLERVQIVLFRFF